MFFYEYRPVDGMRCNQWPFCYSWHRYDSLHKPQRHAGQSVENLIDHGQMQPCYSSHYRYGSVHTVFPGHPYGCRRLDGMHNSTWSCHVFYYVSDGIDRSVPAYVYF